MTDTTWFPNDIWTYIASYLDNKDLANFRQICNITQFVGSHVVILQPLYNRLYALDKTLPAVLPQDNSLLVFKEAFLKIHARQQEEMAHLQEHYPELTSKPEYADVFAQNTSVTLASLEAKNAALDKINNEIMKKFDMNGLTNLNLQGVEGLQSLSCNNNNSLTTLDLQGLEALQFLSFDNNPLIDSDLTGKIFSLNIFSSVTSYLPSFSSAYSNSSVVEEIDEEFKNNKRTRLEEEGVERLDGLKKMKKD